MRFDGETFERRMFDAGFSTQTSLAKQAGVNQSQVSFAKHGKSISKWAGEAIESALKAGHSNYPKVSPEQQEWIDGSARAWKLPASDDVVEYFLEIEGRAIGLLNDGDEGAADHLLKMLPDIHARNILDWYFFDDAPTPVSCEAVCPPPCTDRR